MFILDTFVSGTSSPASSTSSGVDFDATSYVRESMNTLLDALDSLGSERPGESSEEGYFGGEQDLPDYTVAGLTQEVESWVEEQEALQAEEDEEEDARLEAEATERRESENARLEAEALENEQTKQAETLETEIESSDSTELDSTSTESTTTPVETTPVSTTPSNESLTATVSTNASNTPTSLGAF